MEETYGVALLRFLTVLKNFQTLLTFGEVAKFCWRLEKGSQGFCSKSKKKEAFLLDLCSK